MPEVSLKTSEWVLKNLAKRGAYVHLDTQVTGAVDGNIELSTGEISRADLIIWTAGVMANPTVVRGGDLPVEERGRIRTRADLRVGTEDEIVEGAWAAGDVVAVPDLTGGGVGGYCVPNAQHAVRQGKLLAKNLVAVLRGEVPQRVLPQEPRRRRRASACTTASSSRARSRSRASSPGSPTAATTASRCPRGSASSACSGAGGTTSGSAATS